MQTRNEIKEIFLGILLLLGLHIIAIAIFIAIAYISTALNSGLAIIFGLFVYAIGLSQFIYAIPLVIWLYQRQKWGLMKGVIIGAVLTALLNGGGLFWLVSTCSYG